MEHWVELGKALQVGAFAALTVVAIHLWRRQRGAVVLRIGAMFGSLAAAVLLLWAMPHSGWQRLAAALIVAVLVVYPLLVATPLLWAGRELGAVARRRSRMLSGASIVAAACVLAGGLVGSAAHPAAALALQGASLVAAVFVVLGLAPPPLLRTAWRRGEEAALRQAERELANAATPAEVTAPALPPITRMLGGDAALITDTSGRVIASYRVDEVTAAAAASRVATRAVNERSFDDGILTVPLRAGWLVVYASPYAPPFGNGEVALAQRLGLVIDMALERAESIQNDRGARAAVQQAHTEMETLLYTVSHDLKSPLLTVLGYIDLLRTDGSVPDGPATHFIERMEGSALYMQHLIHDLLELSRIGRREANATDVDLSEVVAEVADELRARHPAAYVGIGLLPTVTMSAVRARQLVTNLVENAFVHSGRDDVTVEVGAQRRSDGGARLWVGDDGRGVPAEHHERMFGVFERLDDRPRHDTGTGIGLAACRKIVEHLGGSIRLVDVQKGTCVEIVLPPDVVRWQRSAAVVSA